MRVIHAKNFQLDKIDGGTFDLFAYQGDMWLLLIFFRGEWCHYCRQQLKAINTNLQWFSDRSVKVVAVSADTNLFTSILQDILGAKFEILADEQWKAFSQYGLKQPEDPKDIMPALFIVNPKHEIVFTHIGKSYRDRPSLTKIRTELEKRV